MVSMLQILYRPRTKQVNNDEFAASRLAGYRQNNQKTLTIKSRDETEISLPGTCIPYHGSPPTTIKAKSLISKGS